MADAGVIEGRVVHKTNNALQISFQDGPGDPFATGVQGAGDGKGKKLGVLFGFKNGGTGKHLVTFDDGGQLFVESKDGAPSVLTHPDGATVATIQRGETSVALSAGGNEILRFGPDPDGAKTVEAYRLLVSAPDSSPVARLDIIRTVGGWTVSRAVDAAADLYIWWDRAGQPLKVPILGTRLTLDRPLSTSEREVLVGVCVDIAIGLRPYVTEMK